jgi:hypothetical protein
MSLDRSFGIATNGLSSVPIVFDGGKTLSYATCKGKTMYISGRDVFLPDVMVKTSFDEYVKFIKRTNKREANHIFPQVWNNIKNVDTDKLYREQGQAWSNLMDDIMIYYACRFILFKTPAPVVGMD